MIQTCDSCGPAVSAKYLVKMIDGELTFCGHHYNKNKDALDKLSYEIVDLSPAVQELEDVEI